MKTITWALIALFLTASTFALASCDDGSEDEQICCDCRCTGTGPNLALCSKMDNVPLGDGDDCRATCAAGPCAGICMVLTAAEADCE